MTLTRNPDGARRFARHLLRGESVVAATRRHWARLLEPSLTAFAGLIVMLWLDAQLPAGTPFVSKLLVLGWLALVVRLAYRWLEWVTDWFVATNKRVILMYGLLTRRVAMMPLPKVTDMSYNRSVLGRLLGYGEFVLESAGQDQALRTVSYLPHPDELYEEICGEIFDPAPPQGPPSGPWPPAGPTEQTVIVDLSDD